MVGIIPSKSGPVRGFRTCAMSPRGAKLRRWFRRRHPRRSRPRRRALCAGRVAAIQSAGDQQLSGPALCRGCRRCDAPVPWRRHPGGGPRPHGTRGLWNLRHPATVPLVQLGVNKSMLERFHGPTLAFKDVAMQFIARLMDHILAARGERVTIAVATSGDTGGAAVEAFRGRSNVDLMVLFPAGRISDVQRRMMTTVGDDNVHAFAIDGTFDDCQALVKGLFNRLAVPRSGAAHRLPDSAQPGTGHGCDPRRNRIGGVRTEGCLDGEHARSFGARGRRPPRHKIGRVARGLK